MLPDLFRLIGSDRYLTATEVDRAAEPHSATAAAWDVYTSAFQGFTGATLDPDFSRLANPAARVGRIKLDAGTTVLVAGTEPSLLSHVEAIKAIRERLRIFTSPQGAVMLRENGIAADLILVEHETAVAARHAARQAGPDFACGPDGSGTTDGCSLVAADWRTPASLLRGVPEELLFVPAPMLTWGLWQATAVAMAAAATASRIALVGMDLQEASDARLRALLELLARLAPFTALDCSAHSPKRGWVSATVAETAGTKVLGRIDTKLWVAPSVAERLHQAHAELIELAPIVDRAERLLGLAGQAHEMDDIASTLALEAGIEEVMSWRHQPRVRALLQETLGASFLPRLWRAGVEPSRGRALRRPLLLATHELTRRADTLSEKIAA
jgi:hypothetical protein